ncbi:MAG: ABC transporter substrate-binding protein [Eubacteriales bacterium]|nr:ABC transporter substrate-binding protein [Eubacteriales bacterium]
MRYQKQICMLLALIFAVAFTFGCSPAPAADTAAATASSGTETAPVATAAATADESKNSGDYVYQDLQDAELTFYQYSVENAEIIQSAIDQYETIHPNVKINLESVGGGTDWRTSLKAKISSGDEPTLIALEGVSDFDTFSDMLEDVSDQPWVSHVYDSVLKECTIDSKVVALPACIVCYGLLYNKGIFTACGIDGETLRTYDAIDAAFATVQEAIDSGKLKDQYPDLETVVSLPAAEKWVLVLHGANAALGLEFSNGFDAYNAKTLDFTTAGAFKDYIDLMVKYSADADNPSALNAVDYDSAMGGSFCIQKTAAIQMGQWVQPIVAGVDETMLDQIGVLPIPLKGVDEDNVCYGVGEYFVVNRHSTDAQKAAAKDFLNWFYLSNEGKSVQSNDLGFNVPMDCYGDYPVDNVVSQACNAYAQSGNITPLVFGGYPDGWQDSFGAGIQSYIAGEKDWDTVIQEAKDSWAQLR